MKSVTEDMMAHLGDATAPQRLLVQSVAIKSVRMSLLTEMLLTGAAPSEGSDHHALAWLNSLRLDLMALGLERRVTPSLDLNAYLKEQAKPAADVPADVPEAAD